MHKSGPGALFGPRGWGGVIAALVRICAVAPLPNLRVPQASVFTVPASRFSRIGQYSCQRIAPPA